jgi:3,4-dihydroxy 2-butanone 4-phosphate synthase/GTP cyclohydrolase II
VQPGHIFPLRAQKGGVLMRAGHTEAGCDLTAMAGLTPASVICEIMKDDGTMARLPDLLEFAEHKLKIGTIADLIHYRSRNESIIERVAEREMQTAHGASRPSPIATRPRAVPTWRWCTATSSPAGNPGARAPAGVHPGPAGSRRHHPLVEPGRGHAGAGGRSGVIVLLNCEESAQQMFDQFGALNKVGTPAAKPPAPTAWTCAPTASARRSCAISACAR